MAKILLDYAFPISVITPTPAASTAFLKQVCVVAVPKAGQEANVGELYECSTMIQVAVRTDNTNAQQLFNAGMAKVYILLANDLDIDAMLLEHDQNFFTVLISSDFDDDDIAGAKAHGAVTITSYANLVSGTDDVVTVNGVAFTAQTGAATPGAATFQAATSNDLTAASLAAQINAHAVLSLIVVATAVAAVVTIRAARGLIGNAYTLTTTDNDTNVGCTVSGALFTGGTVAADFGAFKGVIGIASTDDDVLEDQAVIANRVAFDTATGGNGPKNMFYAFGKLLSNASQWRNLQYEEMPLDDGIVTLGEANSRFDDKISFVLNDDEFGKRLALFAAGSKAIVSPYILKNLMVDLQSAALTWISGNQPAYSITNASLLEARLQEDVINSFISRGWITAGTIQISIVEDNFVATGAINVAEPKALWRVFNEMQQTL